MYGFIRIGAAVPRLKVADCIYNKEQILDAIREAQKQQVKVLTFPELSLTGYTCADLFFQQPLLHGAQEALKDIAAATADVDMVIAVGVPVALDNQLFNCAALLCRGRILGLVPKTFIPNYSEFYEERWFSSSRDLISEEITFAGQRVPIGADLLFSAENVPGLKIGLEICEDLWVPIPPSSYAALYGATVLLNLSASNELASKPLYRRQLVSQQASRCLAAYVYTSAGIGESTQDAVFSGHSLICENGVILGETESFSREGQVVSRDVDLELLTNERRRHTTFMEQLSQPDAQRFYREISFRLEDTSFDRLARAVSDAPFVPADTSSLDSRCQNIFQIQVTGLARRMEHTHANTLVIGISGGLDSTLALLVSVKACDYLGIPRDHVLGVTMPGFGTTDRTYHNALDLMASLGIQTREISIRDAALQHFSDIGHDPSVHDVTYENTQARERTQILMDLANQANGLVVGTGDLSELALGWATYNGDHMSMYGVNAGVPKTLVRVLVHWVAQSGTLSEKASDILFDVLDTPISPELLPPDQEGKINQKTEDLVGPYELHDFFLFQILRFGFHPDKVLYLAEQAFQQRYDRDTLVKWLKNFYRRFFIQQFKRSCLPDGPKVGALCLSPRSDWRMPSDASSRLWMEEAEKL
ncbi:NAD(+) synthase [Anaerotignum lactatifermentans]|uniref:Glutamine-dependent NAD(+) synthetase n=1 Tax=Anaerotignum lactatifermentans TaxID=160404 RepID=A0ABS2GB71_9FIRM|nr:NAD(+) synthase [Anaerotignum lactatifermentans]MBM6830169.1 NAD(+) synthase [Anaerotignum lactatifermentans]MBM6878686.1 NAD(+) synthase [Anaerotignum lactatifermentans]MBM6951782.1 NAD(+) synthase [Anaerotignum lactatifermentans]